MLSTEAELIDGTEITLNAYRNLFIDTPQKSTEAIPPSEIIHSIPEGVPPNRKSLRVHALSDLSTSDNSSRTDTASETSAVSVCYTLKRSSHLWDTVSAVVSTGSRFNDSLPPTSPMNNSSISFADILSSTPIPHYEDPRNWQPLDLSISHIEESPLDCSMSSDGVEPKVKPLDLVVVKSLVKPSMPKTECALNFICHDRTTSQNGLSTYILFTYYQIKLQSINM